MKISSPELLVADGCLLGEGPSWDAARQQLYWVDIIPGILHLYHPAEGRDESFEIGKKIGCVTPTLSGRVMLGLKDGLALYQPHAHGLLYVAQPETALPGNRFNDGKCDPSGRLLAGTMDDAEESTTGSLYSLGADGLKILLGGGIGISNGLSWSPDYKTLYYIDTPTRNVTAFDYDLTSGEIANPRVAISFPDGMGWPDGMTSDMHGNLWVAMWGGAALTVWDPQSAKLLESIPVPAKNVTSCAFGGPDMNELYVSSARKGLNPAELSEYPHTGGLFRFTTGVSGFPTFAFDDSSFA